jgi:hypothetical protein
MHRCALPLYAAGMKGRQCKLIIADVTSFLPNERGTLSVTHCPHKYGKEAAYVGNNILASEDARARTSNASQPWELAK